mgnify:CR=1 FL=1
MNHRLLYISLALVAFLCAGMTLYAQNERPESKYENMLIEAVGKYNARDLDGAGKILKEIVAGDEKNDVISYVSAIANMEAL